MLDQVNSSSYNNSSSNKQAQALRSKPISEALKNWHLPMTYTKDKGRFANNNNIKTQAISKKNKGQTHTASCVRLTPSVMFMSSTGLSKVATTKVGPGYRHTITVPNDRVH